MTENSIQLPKPLVKQCEERIDGTEFESVEDYVQFVMTTVVEPETEKESDQAAANSDTGVSSDVEDRLSSLGYR